MAKKASNNLQKSLKELKEISDWFEDQEEVDVETGLSKVKTGVKLIKTCKEKLGEIENEFKELKKELD
jgi:exonuclease VII small subunit